MKSQVIIFAKSPERGEVKTRLASVIGLDSATGLARAFLEDTYSSVRTLRWAEVIIATTDIARARLGTHGLEVWDQGGGDLGQRIERVMQRALGQGQTAIAIGADTPGLPLTFLEKARDAFRRADAVVGPAEDGGFYLLGLSRCPAGLLLDLPWSAADTFSQLLIRLQTSGLNVTLLDPWFDVDRAADLARLRQLLDCGTISAPATLRALQSVHSPGDVGDAAQ